MTTHDDPTPQRRDRLIVASNRGPVSWRRDADGDWRPSRGAGGLIVALGGALQSIPGTWVSVALDEGDLAMTSAHDHAAFEADTGQGVFTLRLVDAGEDYGPYYNHVCNRQLWFTLHQLWNEPYTPAGVGWRADFEAYQRVNHAVADAVVAEAGNQPDPEIHLHDYHLLTAASRIREALPDARILQYVHTPWVAPTYFRRLPDPLVGAVMDGLASCDVVGVSATEWARSLRDCLVELGGGTVAGQADPGTWVTTPRGPTLVAPFVLGVDAEGLRRVAESPEARAERTALLEEVGDRRLIVRADRTDLSKNILRGLHAFDQMLRTDPALTDTVHMRALLDPSRQSVPEYREYLERCVVAAQEIHQRHGPEVLGLETEKNFPRVVAALQSYDVLLTNPVLDGTNLVAKEGPALNERDGVLVLSRHAGAADALADALQINPFDVDQTAEAMAAALSMPSEERSRRAAGLRRAAEAGTPAEWLAAQRRALHHGEAQ